MDKKIMEKYSYPASEPYIFAPEQMDSYHNYEIVEFLNIEVAHELIHDEYFNYIYVNEVENTLDFTYFGGTFEYLEGNIIRYD